MKRVEVQKPWPLCSQCSRPGCLEAIVLIMTMLDKLQGHEQSNTELSLASKSFHPPFQCDRGIGIRTAPPPARHYATLLLDWSVDETLKLTRT